MSRYNVGMIYTGTTALPEELTTEDEVTISHNTGGWVVILYNCDCHTFDDVIEQIQKATGCSLEDAVAHSMEAHLKGRAIVFRGDENECERASGVLRSARLQVETDRI